MCLVPHGMIKMFAKYKTLVYLIILSSVVHAIYLLYKDVEQSGYDRAAAHYEREGRDRAEAIADAYSTEIDRVTREYADSNAAALRLSRELSDRLSQSNAMVEELEKYGYTTCDGHVVVDDNFVQQIGEIFTYSGADQD